MRSLQAESGDRRQYTLSLLWIPYPLQRARGRHKRSEGPMTVVTTSRKPLPELRSLARDLAFAIGAGYTTRGKAGMGDLFALDESVVIVSRSGPFFLIQVFVDGETITEITLRSFRIVPERYYLLAMGLFFICCMLFPVRALFTGETLPIA